MCHRIINNNHQRYLYTDVQLINSDHSISAAYATSAANIHVVWYQISVHWQQLMGTWELASVVRPAVRCPLF